MSYFQKRAEIEFKEFILHGDTLVVKDGKVFVFVAKFPLQYNYVPIAEYVKQHYNLDLEAPV